MRSFAVLLLFVGCAPAPAIPRKADAPAAPATNAAAADLTRVARARDPLERIAVIGASASAGFRARATLAEALGFELVPPIASSGAAPASFADERLFLDPAGFGGAQVQRALAIDPTLVIAADFLFWFGYGEVAGEDERLENLEFGLELLDEFACPLVISRFPDMSPAVGRMLMRSQMPRRETLGRLDARLEAWAAARRGVAFVALPEYLTRLRTGTVARVAELEIGGADWRRRLMQSDELHPTAQGLGVLARLCLDAACAAPIGADPGRVAARIGPTLERLDDLSRGRGSHRRAMLPAEDRGVPSAPATPAAPSGG